MVYKSNRKSRRRRSTHNSRRRRYGRRRQPRKPSKSRRSKRRRSKCRRSKRRRSKRRKSRCRSHKRSRKKKSKKFTSVKKSVKLTQPLTIYTAEGCSACTDAKELCDKKGIKYKALDRRKHSEYVKTKTGNCRYVPNVFNSKNEYLGGNEDLGKLLKNVPSK